jgi:hypothetical protein
MLSNIRLHEIVLLEGAARKLAPANGLINPAAAVAEPLPNGSTLVVLLESEDLPPLPGWMWLD